MKPPWIGEAMGGGDAIHRVCTTKERGAIAIYAIAPASQTDWEQIDAM